MISCTLFSGKRGRTLAPLLILVFVLCAFGTQGAEASSWKEIDHAGYEVTIPENHDRILALNPLLMEGLFAIGITPIGKVEGYKIRKEGEALPSVGAQSNIDIESVYKLNPSLIIAHTRFHGDIAKMLRQDGRAVYMVDPGKMGDNPMLDSVVFLGKLLRREDAARSYAESTLRIAEMLEERVLTETDIRSAIVIRDGDKIIASQNATIYGSILRALGIRNIVPENMPGSNKESFIPFDIETIIAENPDIIFIVASSNDPEQNKATVEKYTLNSIWSGLKAVQKDRVLMMPFKVDPGRSTAEEMLRIMAGMLLKNE